MATFYIDADGGNDGNAGTSTGAAWATLAQYTTTTARSAGDIAILRRNTTATYDNAGATLQFDEDGNAAGPIVVEADYDNEFGDDVDLSATATATLTFGSKTVTFSSDISGVLAAGDCIYEVNDDQRLFAYEVESVVTTTATLYLPYKGDNAGSGKTMTNMGSLPVYGLTTSTTSFFSLVSDDYWRFQGIFIKHNATSGGFNAFSSLLECLDCAVEGGSSTSASNAAYSFASQAGRRAYISKFRTFNVTTGLFGSSDGGYQECYDSLFDGNSKSFSSGINAGIHSSVMIFETEIKNNSSQDIGGTQSANGVVFLRNCILSSTTQISSSTSDTNFGWRVSAEDFNGTLNDTRFFYGSNESNDSPSLQSDTGTIRTGGSAISMKVIPNANIGRSKMLDFKLLEIPIYATTDSKTYQVYFKTNATGNWTADPTADEFWIELEAWGHASNNYRKITRSTGVVDFNGSTDWQALSVTVAPAQAGVAYLRAWYRKSKEAQSNEFFMDPLPVIT